MDTHISEYAAGRGTNLRRGVDKGDKDVIRTLMIRMMLGLREVIS